MEGQKLSRVHHLVLMSRTSGSKTCSTSGAIVCACSQCVFEVVPILLLLLLKFLLFTQFLILRALRPQPISLLFRCLLLWPHILPLWSFLLFGLGRDPSLAHHRLWLCYRLFRHGCEHALARLLLQLLLHRGSRLLLIPDGHGVRVDLGVVGFQALCVAESVEGVVG